MASTAGAAGGLLAPLASALAGLTPGSMLLLGGHLTASNEARALQLLMQMKVNPLSASALAGTLYTIPNMPPQVETFAGSAVANIGNPLEFGHDIDEAIASLQQVLASETYLQQQFGV